MESNWNSSAVAEDASTLSMSLNIFHVIANSILFLFGVPGNCLILRIYWAKVRKTSTHILIMALAWADLAVCLLKSTHVVEGILELMGVGKLATTIVFYFWPVECIAIGTSVAITTTIALDRYDCICRPQRRFFSPRRGKMAVGISLLISFGASTPSFMRITDGDSEVLLKLQTAFQSVAFAIALIAIAVCYGKVYAVIRRHVQVGVVLRPITRPEASFKLHDYSSTQVVHNTTAVSTPNVNKVKSTFRDQPSTSQANPGLKRLKIANDENTCHIEKEGTVGKSLKPPHLEHPTGKDVIVEELVQAVIGNKDDGRALRSTGNRKGHAPQNVGATILQRKTTRMLFITSVVFLLTWAPYITWFGVRMAECAGAVIDDVARNICQELLVAVYINNVVNPLIYGLANRRFRQDCRAVFSRIKMCPV